MGSAELSHSTNGWYRWEWVRPGKTIADVGMHKNQGSEYAYWGLLRVTPTRLQYPLVYEGQSVASSLT